MKTVVFSFDDARLDTYTNAFSLMSRYKLPFTINVVTDFVLNPERYTNFKSGNNKSMTEEQLMECFEKGIEIACHGHTHQNTREDVLKNIAELKRMKILDLPCGFASPNSYLTESNGGDIQSLVSEGKLLYTRSGVQIRREGFLYAVLSCLERCTHSPRLFYFLNKRNIIVDSKNTFLKSVAITRHTTVKQILYFVNRMNDYTGVIFMFHSVLKPEEAGYGADDWYFDEDRFQQLLDALTKDENVTFSTTKAFLSKGE